jgi:serine/threonine protein phosphatase PrpC
MISLCLIGTFMKLDQLAAEQLVGTTAAVCVLTDTDLYTAHCGDARVVFRTD